MIISPQRFTFRISALILATFGLALIPTADISAKKPVATASSIAPEIAQTTPARDIDTYEYDRRITNDCVEAGQDKTLCLCVTQVLKYELNFGDYQSAALQYAASDEESEDQAATLLTASTQNTISDLRRREMSQSFQALSQTVDFDNRCRTANRYFMARKTR